NGKTVSTGIKLALLPRRSHTNAPRLRNPVDHGSATARHLAQPALPRKRLDEKDPSQPCVAEVAFRWRTFAPPTDQASP
ncbi:MAG TPA: hypothetical protein VHS81_04905, partial [Caulobacteraceae bacterium]|nr:hypothetical protein [Caulobacteraceae bacterium]